MTRDELETAWATIIQTNEDGNFKYTKKGSEHKIEVAFYMDASLAHYIMNLITEQEAPAPLIPMPKNKVGFE